MINRVRLRLFRAVAQTLMLATFASATMAQSLDQVIARYREWRGGDAYAHLSSVHATGTIETAGLKGSFERWERRDGRARVDLDLGVVKISNGLDRGHGWSVTPSGQVETAASADDEEQRRSLLLNFGDIFAHAKLTLLEPETIEGQRWSVVRAALGEQDKFELLLNAETGALHSVRVFEDQKLSTIRFGEWRSVAGIRVPFLEEVVFPDQARNQVWRLEKVELSVPLHDELFGRPKSAARITFTGGAHTTRAIPFTLFSGRRIFLPASINGHPIDVLLDSGAETTVLDRAFAKEVGLDAQGSVVAQGTGGTTTAGFAKGVNITLGEATLQNLTVAVLDLSDVAQQLGRPLPVILGKEVFDLLNLEIDFEQQRIAFHDPATFVAPKDTVAVPTTAANGIRSVPVSLEGRPPVQADFDLGNGSPLIVFPSYATQQGILKERRSSRALGAGAGGTRQETIAVLSTLTFAGVTFHNVPTTFPDPGLATFDTDHSSANVGLPVLSRFRLTTDFSRNRILVRPAANQDQPFPKDRSGLRTFPGHGHLVVAFVSPGSPAAAGGWHEGDEIIAVNGTPVTAEMTVGQWATAPAGTKCTLTLATGERRELTLADYF